MFSRVTSSHSFKPFRTFYHLPYQIRCYTNMEVRSPINNSSSKPVLEASNMKSVNLRSILQPFQVTCGSDEVNGTYSFAKQIHGISEFWYVKTIKKRKKTLEKIYKIRGGGSLPQFGAEFSQCWVLQHCYSKDSLPIKYYAAPMKSIYDKAPPSSGWICIGGIEPTPKIQSIDLKTVKSKFDALKTKVLIYFPSDFSFEFLD